MALLKLTYLTLFLLSLSTSYLNETVVYALIVVMLFARIKQRLNTSFLIAGAENIPG